MIALLLVIRQRGSLAAAARESRVPYRTAWALLETTERRIGTSLATLQRGRGAVLTPFAMQWVAAHEAASALIAARVPSLDLAKRRSELRNVAPSLRIAASHDLALAQLRDHWQQGYGIMLAFHGSAESLALYRANEVDVAGFHFAASRNRDEPLLALLRGDRDATLRFITRVQGLMLPRGNPRRVRMLADVVRKDLSIVNRQPGSGTRLLIDRLLDQEGIEATSLRGYSNEEFTHAAVAATVAAGKADAGFGIEAAAHQHGLAFVPLLRETYRFVCRRRALDSDAIVAFRELLNDSSTFAVIEALPGYNADRPGALVDRKPA
ncbi:MAG TPA: substrate-binding domain-containing protein [Casimicrobiaceae bacterium]|nr:substrate-binding domain-containing protein [Casimicrobiaceae bacterium]